MSILATDFPLRRTARRRFLSKPLGWLLLLSTAWCLGLIVFNLFPQIDLAVAAAFFREEHCSISLQDQICGAFPYSSEAAFILIRRILFYLPVVAALYLLYVLLKNFQHHGSTYCRRKTRDYVIALTAFVIGPYLLVNLILKQISNRPRPYETNLFGGHELFMPAGSFQGACTSNCSFVSGEAAGAGWIACLIVLMPKHLRPIFAPPLIAISLVSPALRISFGGHYLSDVVLGWLSSLIVYAAVAAYLEMSQQQRNRTSPTFL